MCPLRTIASHGKQQAGPAPSSHAHAHALQIVGTVVGGGRLPVPPPEELPGDGGAFSRLPEYLDLMSRCWAQDPGQRPLFPEVIADLRCTLGTLRTLCTLGTLGTLCMPPAARGAVPGMGALPAGRPRATLLCQAVPLEWWRVIESCWSPPPMPTT